ncbi:hypothetical protein CCHL11_02117 [Colletotrichum chlorophyti]|uniref:BTB domain-containing protein n=1 Tax=Colletotrichum chlorophyti TaxID=708187 RepID=A0A1Q8S747_9PEZI|nr:hypothetical protein CCHL11_02117 [Colletotrichum chlorophyti]
MSSRSSSSSSRSASLVETSTSEPKAENKPRESYYPRTPVAPNGELILEVGFRARERSQEIRVHAVILSNASPVFASMLEASRFGEGIAVQVATASNPARIALPDDDFQAMEIICRIIHGRAADPKSSSVLDLRPSEILDVAITADKYDCVPALALAIEHWLKPGKAGNLTKNGQMGVWVCDLLMAAYWFRHAAAFETVSGHLISDIAGSFRSLADDREGVQEHLAMKLALALEERRNELRLCLFTSLTDALVKPASCDCRKSWWRPRPLPSVVETVIRRINRDVLSQGMPYMSISEAMRRAEEIPTAAYNRVGRSTIERTYKHKNVWRPWHKGSVSYRIREFKEKELEGLCLRCVHPQMQCDVEAHGEARVQRFEEWAARGRWNPMVMAEGGSRVY